MVSITDSEIVEKLKLMENKIKSKQNFSREDIQNCLNAVWGYGLSPNRKKEILKDMIVRTGVKKIGLKTLYTPRVGLVEGDKTLDFLSDLLSYRGVRERY